MPLTTDERRIAAYEIQSAGVEWPDYWQGVGTSFTDWTEVAAGLGENASEAYEDAVEQLAQSGWNVDTLPKRPRGVRKTDRVRDEDRSEDGESPSWYVYVYVR